MELVSRPFTVNDSSHLLRHEVYEMVEEFYIQGDFLPCI